MPSVVDHGRRRMSGPHARGEAKVPVVVLPTRGLRLAGRSFEPIGRFARGAALQSAPARPAFARLLLPVLSAKAPAPRCAATGACSRDLARLIRRPEAADRGVCQHPGCCRYSCLAPANTPESVCPSWAPRTRGLPAPSRRRCHAAHRKEAAATIDSWADARSGCPFLPSWRLLQTSPPARRHWRIPEASL